MSRRERSNRMTVSITDYERDILKDLLRRYRAEVDPRGTLDHVISRLIQQGPDGSAGNGGR